MDNRPSKRGGALDKAAIGLSGLCLAHCLLLPVAVILLPFLSQFDVGHFHVQMLFVVVPVSLIAFSLGFRRHRRRRVVIWGLAGIGTMIVGGTLAHEHYGVLADSLLTMVGASILAVTHYWNNRLTRHAKSASCDDPG